jgi:hypothetical protein
MVGTTFFVTTLFSLAARRVRLFYFRAKNSLATIGHPFATRTNENQMERSIDRSIDPAAKQQQAIVVPSEQCDHYYESISRYTYTTRLVYWLFIVP